MNRLIFGCGYLGSRVARVWQGAGDRVFAVTRSKSRANEFAATGFIPIVADVTNPATLAELPAADTVLVAIGMDRTRYSDIRTVYVEGLRAIVDALPTDTNHLIYISSTGVYGQSDDEWVDENSPTHPTREGGQACLEAEQLLFQSRFANICTILRPSGIYGKGRVPGLESVKARQWSQLATRGFLNLAHVDDIVTAIKQTSALKLYRETILVSDGNPIDRREYYQLLATELGLGEISWPQWASQSDHSRSTASKRINNQKMLNLLGFQPKFPHVKLGLKDALGTTDS